MTPQAALSPARADVAVRSFAGWRSLILAPMNDSTKQQLSYRVRHDWASTGATAIAANADVAVVVDVLSFTTTLSVATDVEVSVLPYRWHDDGAARFAAQHDAVLAVGRRAAHPGQI